MKSQRCAIFKWAKRSDILFGPMAGPTNRHPMRLRVCDRRKQDALPAVDRAGDEVGYPSIWVIQKTLLNLVRSTDQWSDGPTD